MSAGVLLVRGPPTALQLLIVHPGGPFWARRDAGAWSIPKGELESGEQPIDAARREFTEETGWPCPQPLVPLGSVRQKAGKVVHGFTARGDVDVSTLASPTLELEWPRGSGRKMRFSEIDRAAWCSPSEARRRLNPAQVEFIDRVMAAMP